MATILIRTLPILELRVVGVDEDTVEAASAVESIALQRLAPAVIPLGTDVVSDALFHRNLKSMVVGVLVRANDVHLAIERVGRRGAELGVERPAIVDGRGGIVIATGFSQIGAGLHRWVPAAVMLNCGPLISL